VNSASTLLKKWPGQDTVVEGVSAAIGFDWIEQLATSENPRRGPHALAQRRAHHKSQTWWLWTAGLQCRTQY